MGIYYDIVLKIGKWIKKYLETFFVFFCFKNNVFVNPELDFLDLSGGIDDIIINKQSAKNEDVTVSKS